MLIVTPDLNQSTINPEVYPSESNGCKSHVFFACLMVDRNDFVDIFYVVQI